MDLNKSELLQDKKMDTKQLLSRKDEKEFEKAVQHDFEEKGKETFGQQKFGDKNEKELATIANKHGLQTADLKAFVDTIMSRMIFDGEKLTDLLEPLELSWKERRVKELELMGDLVPQLKKIAQGREISGLAAYE